MTDNNPELENLDKIFKKGYTFYQDKNYEKAVEFISKSIKKEGEHYLKTFYIGLSYLEQMKFRDAIQLFNKVLEQGKETFNCLLYLTHAYRQIKDYENTLDSYTKFLKLDLNTIQRENIVNMKLEFVKELESRGQKVQLEDEYEKGLYEFNSDRFEHAISYLLDSITKNPSFFPAYYYKSGAHVQIGEFENALESMEKFTELNPKSSRGWIGKALIHSQMGEYEKAIENGNKALELQPNSTRIKNHLNSFYKSLKKVENMTDKEKSDELVHMGWEEQKFGSLQKALMHFNAAIKLDVKNRAAWDGKIKCVDDMEQIKLYHRALEIFPEDSLFWYETGVWYRRMKQSQKAIDCYEKVIKFDKDNKSGGNHEYMAWDAMGNAYWDMKEYNKAIEAYKKVIQHEKTYFDSDTYTKIGDLCLELNNTSEAIENYEKALKFERPNRSALHKLNKLKKKRF